MLLVINYSIALVSFLLIDFIWLGLVASDFYQNQIGQLLREKFLLLPAFIFYLIFVFGLLVFAVSPALSQNSMTRALILGGLFGFVAYATYDLTNFATIREWPLLLTIVDMLWGTVLGATVAALTVFLSQKLGIK